MTHLGFGVVLVLVEVFAGCGGVRDFVAQPLRALAACSNNFGYANFEHTKADPFGCEHPADRL